MFLNEQILFLIYEMSETVKYADGIFKEQNQDQNSKHLERH